MTELVQRLRDWERIYPEDQDEPDHCLCLKAADRIEELEAKLLESEALLAKAVEIGDKMAASIEGNYYLPGVATDWRKLTGDKDE